MEATGLQQQALTMLSNSGSKQVSCKSNNTIEFDDELSILRKGKTSIHNLVLGTFQSQHNDKNKY